MKKTMLLAVLVLCVLLAGCANVRHKSTAVIPAGTVISVTDEGGVTVTTTYTENATVETEMDYCRFGDQTIEGLEIIFANGASATINKQQSQTAETIGEVVELIKMLAPMVVPVVAAP